MPAELPLPPHYDAGQVGAVWRVPYEALAIQAADWASYHGVSPASRDSQRTCLLIIDAQNTFCTPGFELFVGGRSGTGAVDDMDRLCQFIYRNLGAITQVVVTMDTHEALQIFHPSFLVNKAGVHPPPMTLISLEDVREGRWRVDPAAAAGLDWRLAGLSRPPSAGRLQEHLEHYVRQLSLRGKYLLTVWPYHAMLGGIGHALVSAVEAACFFHSLARRSQTVFEVKGRNPLTENYSALSPEVLTTVSGSGQPRSLAKPNAALISYLLGFDRLIIAGEAQSHCVAWTVDDLLTEIQQRDPGLADRVTLLKDCMSPVYVPDVVDYTDDAEAAMARFVDAGMRAQLSTDPLD